MAGRTTTRVRLRRLGALTAIGVLGSVGAGHAVAATADQSGVGFTCEGVLATRARSRTCSDPDM